MPALAAAATMSLGTPVDTVPAGKATVKIDATGNAAPPNFDQLEVYAYAGAVDCATPGGFRTFVEFLPLAGSLSVVETFTPPAAGTVTLCGVVSDFNTGQVLATASTSFVSLGPVPGDIYNCADFPLPDGTTAQQYLQRWPTDPSHLDGDNDGIACEGSTPPPPPPAAPPPAAPTAVVPQPPIPAARAAAKPSVLQPRRCRVLRRALVVNARQLRAARVRVAAAGGDSARRRVRTLTATRMKVKRAVSTACARVLSN